MATLVEQYKNRIALAESVYGQKHNGQKLDNYKKLIVAKCLENTNR